MNPGRFTAATCRSLWVSTPATTTRLTGSSWDGMLAMSALLAGAGRVGRGLAEEGGQDSDGAWWRRLPSGHTVDEAEPRRAPPSHRQIRGKTAVVNRKCGSGSSGSVRHRVSWRVHRCAGQEAQEHPAPTFSL